MSDEIKDVEQVGGPAPQAAPVEDHWEEAQPARRSGGGVNKWVIYIGILVGINILSAVFDWGFWIY